MTFAAGNGSDDVDIAPAPLGAGAVPAAARRRFDALIVDWRVLEPAAPGAEYDDDLQALSNAIETLCTLGVHVTVVAEHDVSHVDARLQARPTGPGRLVLTLASGIDRREVDTHGPRVAQWRDAADDDSEHAVVADLWLNGIGSSLVLVIGDAIDPVPRDAVHIARDDADGDVVLACARDQIARRDEGEMPRVELRNGWCLEFDGVDHERERVVEALLTLADGRTGTSGAPLSQPASTIGGVVVAGVYRGEGADADLLVVPRWDRLGAPVAEAEAAPHVWRALDLHTGVLVERASDANGFVLDSLRFASLARPGTAVLRAESTVAIEPGAPVAYPDGDAPVVAALPTGEACLVVEGIGAGVAVAAAQEVAHDRRLDRVAVYERVDEGVAVPRRTLTHLHRARSAGLDVLLSEHRSAWAKRWEHADIEINGDDHLQLAARVALYHLMASVPDTDEAAVGARGLSGHAYKGHVFWDADVFVLPFLAATHAASARAMLEYRVRRLPAARAAAWSEGREGARFPWESATLGDDVTPHFVRDQTGRIVPIRTGESELHITSDVAWAAMCYVDWTGDAAFAAGPGHRILVESARYWSSRVRFDGDGHAHIYGVIGPDEYHEPVDDNAYTNLLARWNLRRAAASVLQHGGASPEERRHWLAIADALIDGYDATTGVYEQFAGFFKLEAILIADVAPRRPITADLLLGRERVRSAQIIKQPDVLMAQHLIPGDVAPGSLEPNLAFYDPRTAHGSSLSPGIHAALLARAGRLDEALHWLRVAADVDLDDVTGTTAGGLHVATMGSLWQALAWGFVGARPRDDALAIDPRLPAEWDSLTLNIVFRGVPVRVHVDHHNTHVVAARSITLFANGAYHDCGPGGIVLPAHGGG